MTVGTRVSIRMDTEVAGTGMAEVGVVFAHCQASNALDVCSGENSEDDAAVERARRTMRQLSSEPETICFMLGLNASDVTTSR